MSTAEPSSIASLRVATFRRLWLALIVFNLGHLIQVVAASWLILELTSSPFWVSLAIAAPTLPLLFLSLPAGAAADLLDRRKILVASSALLATASLGLAALWSFDLITPTRLVALELAIGIGVAFFSPAWQANIPSLVPTNLVPGAVSLTSASGGLATALGPALGGVLVATIGPGWAFGAAAIGYSTLLIAAYASQDVEWNHERGSMAIAIATGVRYLRFSRNYLWLLLVGSLFGFTSAALRSMLPNITSDVLGGDSTLYGTLLGVFGMGALLGGLTRSFAKRLFGQRVIPVGIILFGIFSLAVGISTLVWVTTIVITFCGLLWTWILSTLSSTFQMLTPDWVRGRTMSAFVLSVFGFLPLGAIAAGAIGESFGADSSLVLFSLFTIAVGGIASWMPLPVLEQIDPPVVPESTADSLPEAETAAKPVMVTNSWTIEEESFDAAVELLAELRLLRLSTGAYHWAAYRSAKDLTRVTEVFMLHSWDHHLQQHRRLDLEALEVIGRMEKSGVPGSLVRDHLVAFDVDHPSRRPAWQHFLAEHEQMHLPHIESAGNQEA